MVIITVITNLVIYCFQRRYLEKFGYLATGRPEVGNLVHEDAAEFYEDEEKIAIKTLQVLVIPLTLFLS